MKKGKWIILLLTAFLATALWGCGSDSKPAPAQGEPVIEDPVVEDPVIEPAVKNPGDIQVQVAYDADMVAFRFMWKGHEKSFPINAANNGQVYPGQFHDLLQFNGTAFVREGDEEQRFNEDRVSFMLEDPTRAVPGFDKSGCYVSCHAGMASHRLSTTLPVPQDDPVRFLDMWHWRGQRSGPMGYAEDTWVSNVQRERDARSSAAPAFFGTSDNLRQDQGALANTNSVNDGLPRFVFNKGKEMPGGFVIPGFFLTLADGTVITEPFAQAPLLQDVANNRTLLVVYQDRTFDPVDKVNAIDLGYLVYVALDRTNQLPAHLRDESSAAFAAWTAFWAQELGIAAEPRNAAVAAAAEARLADIRQELTNSGNAAITRSVALIYPSDQHDIATVRSFDATHGVWTVTMYRKLNTGNPNDTSLAGLAGGTVYNLGFAIHDIGDAHESHHISLPYKLGNAASTAEIKAVSVAGVEVADWSQIDGLLTRVFAADEAMLGTNAELVTYTELKDFAKHPGAGSTGAIRCQDCHNGGLGPVLNP
jgi:hypothetical protein